MRRQRETMAEGVFDLVAAAVTEPGDEAAEEDEGHSEELASTRQDEPIEELGTGQAGCHQREGSSTPCQEGSLVGQEEPGVYLEVNPVRSGLGIGHVVGLPRPGGLAALPAGASGRVASSRELTSKPLGTRHS